MDTFELQSWWEHTTELATFNKQLRTLITAPGVSHPRFFPPDAFNFITVQVLSPCLQMETPLSPPVTQLTPDSTNKTIVGFSYLCLLLQEKRKENTEQSKYRITQCRRKLQTKKMYLLANTINMKRERKKFVLTQIKNKII